MASVGIWSLSMEYEGVSEFNNAIRTKPAPTSSNSCAMKFFIKKFQGSQSKEKGKGAFYPSFVPATALEPQMLIIQMGPWNFKSSFTLQI